MKLGFIGTGKITSSVISGICSSKINYKKIFISSRNSLIAKGLKKKFKKIFIEKDNQKIVDNCDWIFLAVTPTVGEKIIKNLRFRSSQTIISFISTINLSELRKMIKVKADLVRAIPLPPISLKKDQYLSAHQIERLKIFLIKLDLLLKLKMKNYQLIFGQRQG